MRFLHSLSLFLSLTVCVCVCVCARARGGVRACRLSMCRLLMSAMRDLAFHQNVSLRPVVRAGNNYNVVCGTMLCCTHRAEYRN